MKKRILSILLSLCMVCMLLPTTALAEEAQPEESLPGEQLEQVQPVPDEPEENEEQPQQDEAVDAVQALIDALPDASALDEMDAEAQESACLAASEAYDAYDALTEEQQSALTGADNMIAILEWAARQVAPSANTTTGTEHQSHPICGKNCTHTGSDTHEGVTWTGVDSLDKITGAGNYYLTKDVALDRCSWNVSTGTTVLCLNGHTIKTDKGFDAITVPSSATFTLTDCKTGFEQGKITHDEGNDGRGVYVNPRGTFNMYGGSISGNTTTDGYSGGGVYVNSGTFNMYGGSITGNTANGNGGGVYVDSGTFTMSGGIIGGTGNDANTANLNGGGVYVDGTFNMSGSAAITGNNAIGSYGGGVYMAGGTFTMSGTASITGNKATSGDTGSGGGVYVKGGTFTMSGNASITGNKATSKGGGVYVTGNSTFNMSDGSISDNTAEIGNGGGVYMAGGEFTMSGGTIEENLATDSTRIYGEGGGVHINSGIFTMLGGSITGNQASEKGGGVCVGGNATAFTVSGNVAVTENLSRGTANDVYLYSGKYITVDGKLDSTAKIGVTCAAIDSGAFVTVATGAKGSCTEGNFTANKGEPYCIKVEQGADANRVNVNLYNGLPHQHPICGETCTHTDSDAHNDVTWTPLTSANGKPYAGSTALGRGKFNATEGYVLPAGHYYLSDALNLNLPLLIKNGVYLCLNGQTLSVQSSNSAIIIDKNCDLTLCDCSEEQPGKITHAASATGRGVYMGTSQGSANSYNGSFTMYGGSITGNHITADSGAGVYMRYGTFNMHGGSITGNTTAENYGTGGVYVSGGEFNMTGGRITDTGGGVRVDGSGTFNMSGDAVISNNNAYSGGGVYVFSGTFTMTGGSITNNTATQNGGGVYVYADMADTAAAFTMDGNASVSGNSAKYGGGVYMNGYSGFTMSSNAAITGNSAKTEGGGVYATDGTFTMSGGVQIKDNCKGGTLDGTTGKYTGGSANNLYLYNNKTITIGTGGLTAGAEIGVTTAQVPTEGGKVLFATGANNEALDYTKIFTPDAADQSYVVTKDESGKLYLSTHQHSWKYEANGATITATCEDCPLATGGSTTYSGSITVKAPASTPTYDGNPKEAMVETTDEGLTAPKITYKQSGADLSGTPTDAGTYIASITVTGAGEGNTATAFVTYTINPKEVSSPTIKFGDSDTYTCTYTGNEQKPTVTVKDGETVIPTTEYTVAYGNNINAGVNTATVTITDKAGGNYTVSGSKTFTINAKNIADVTAAPIPDQTYTGSPITLGDVILTYNDNRLTKDTDYTLGSYANNVNVGNNTASVTITGKGNYTGTKDITFNIKEADMTGITVTGYNAAYDGNVHGISVIVPNTYDGATVTYSTNGTDYSFDNQFTDFTNGDKTVYYKVSKANYNDVKGSATVNITKATLAVDGTLTASADYGTAVKGITNFSGATVKRGDTIIAGTWAFPSDNTTVPNVTAPGSYTATFTPSAGAGNYETLTQDVTPTISKVNPTAPTGLTGKQGNTLSSVTLPDGWTWVNGTTPMNTTGNQTFKANYAGSNNYNVASNVDVTVTVSSKASQSNFKFATLTQTKTYGDADFTLAAIGEETGSTVTYESSDTSVATVDNSGKVHILKAGTATITATASATPVYAETTASYALTVNKAAQTITVPGDKTIIKNGVAVDISDWASVAGVANGAVPGALSYALNGTYDGVTLSGDNKLTVQPSFEGDKVTIKVTAAEKEDYYNKATETFDVTVSEKGSATLSVTQDGWTYGGDTKSPSYTKPVGTIDDTIKVTYAVKDSGVFSASAPTNAGNYTVKVVLETADTVYSGTADFTISPKTLTSDDLEFTTGSTFTKVYDGNTTCATATVQIKADAKENESDALPGVSGTYAYNSANVNEASKVTFTSASSSNTNYVLPAGLICVHAASITKADQAALTVTSTTATYGTDLTLTVSGGTGDGAVTYVVTDGADKATVSESTLHPTKAGTVTVTATKSGGDNYNDVSSSATTITIAKATPIVTPPTPVASLTYNGEEQTLINAGSTTGGTLQYRLNSDGVYSTALPKATAAGDSNVYYKVVGDENFVDVAESYITVTIAEKNVTVAPKSVTITQGDAIPTFELNYTGLVDGDTLTHSEAPVFTCYEADGTTPVSTGTAVGTYTITWTNEGVTTFTGADNYNVTKTATGTLTINARPVVPVGGGSYTPPTYKVESEVTESTDGNVSFSKGSAKKGDTVTITVTPDRYYKVDSVTVKDKNGNEIDVIDNGDGTFSFKMPASEVAVEPTFSWDNPFTDVAEDTYYTPAVEWALKNDITNGTGDGTTFSPDDGCTRAQIVTFLWKVAGCPEPADMGSFTDVSADAYYAKAVAWAVEQGITNGTGNGKFSPDATCTRSQSMTFLYHVAGSPEVADGISFSDVAADSYYADAVVWAAQNGVTNGTGDGTTFSPGVGCTRGQIMTFLYRWLVK